VVVYFRNGNARLERTVCDHSLRLRAALLIRTALYATATLVDAVARLVAAVARVDVELIDPHPQVRAAPRQRHDVPD